MSRYLVVKGSQSGHCCFDFTVVDTNRPRIVGGRQYQGQFEAVCETFDEEDASLIAKALNAAEDAQKGAS